MHQNRSEARIERQRDARRENERPIGCEGVREGEEPCRQPDTGLRNKEQISATHFCEHSCSIRCVSKSTAAMSRRAFVKPYPAAVVNGA